MLLLLYTAVVNMCMHVSLLTQRKKEKSSLTEHHSLFFSRVFVNQKLRKDSLFLFLVPAGRRAPGNQSGRGKEGGAQSLLGNAVREQIRKWC